MVGVTGVDDDRAELVFLGTGASGGTPGRGRSRRMESSLLARHSAGAVLVDATRHLPAQSRAFDRLDLLLLTHAHRDASGGVPALRRWWAGRAGSSGSRRPPIPTLAHPTTLARLAERYRRLDHLDPVPFRTGERATRAGWTITAAEVPHDRHPERYPTYAWRLERAGRVLVYASDAGRLTPDLAGLARGADLLVLDGAMWQRSLYAHLRADEALPEVCRWPVRRLLLTQIGRTAPPHAELARRVAALCPRACPAYDSLVERL